MLKRKITIITIVLTVILFALYVFSFYLERTYSASDFNGVIIGETSVWEICLNIHSLKEQLVESSFGTYADYKLDSGEYMRICFSSDDMIVMNKYIVDNPGINN